MKKILFFTLVMILVLLFGMILVNKPNVTYKPKMMEVAKDTSDIQKPMDQSNAAQQPSNAGTQPATETPKEIDTPQEPVIEEPETFTANYINSDNVRIRSAPSLSADIYKELPIGTKVSIWKVSSKEGDPVPGFKKGNWKIIYGKDFYGYVYDAFISTVTYQNPDYKPAPITLVKNTGVRYSDSENSSILLKLPAETKVLATARSKEKSYITGMGNDYWYKIEHGKVDGWVFGQEFRWEEQ